MTDLFATSPRTEGMLVMHNDWLAQASHEIASMDHKDCEFAILTFLSGAEFTPAVADSIAILLAVLLTSGAEVAQRMVVNAHLESLLAE